MNNRGTIFAFAVMFGSGIGGLIGDYFGIPAYVGLLVGMFAVFGLFLFLHGRRK